MGEEYKNLKEIIELAEEEIKKEDENVTAVLDLEDLKELKKLLRSVKIKDEYLKLIWSIGFDYDGLDGSIEGLKSVIDNLVEYARMALNDDDKTVIYGAGEDSPKKNILFEEIKKEG